MTGREIEEPIARDGPEDLATQLAPAGLLDSLFVRVEIRCGESRGLEVRSERVTTLVAAGLGDGVDDTALEIAVLRADAQPAHLDGLDPVDAQRKKVAAEPRMVHGDAIELIIVRNARRTAPKLISARAGHE